MWEDFVTMSSHRVFCQPVIEHVIGEREKPSGFTLYKDVHSRNAHFSEIDQKYDLDHEAARRKGHCLADGYTYLKPIGEPYWGIVEDDIFDRIGIVENGKKIHHFPDLKPPAKAE